MMSDWEQIANQLAQAGEAALEHLQGYTPATKSQSEAAGELMQALNEYWEAHRKDDENNEQE